MRSREISWSFLRAQFRKTSRKIASSIHGIPDDRRETSPVRNDRNNLPLSFVSCLIQGIVNEKKEEKETVKLQATSRQLNSVFQRNAECKSCSTRIWVVLVQTVSSASWLTIVILIWTCHRCNLLLVVEVIFLCPIFWSLAHKCYEILFNVKLMDISIKILDPIFLEYYY